MMINTGDRADRIIEVRPNDTGVVLGKEGLDQGVVTAFGIGAYRAQRFVGRHAPRRRSVGAFRENRDHNGVPILGGLRGQGIINILTSEVRPL